MSILQSEGFLSEVFSSIQGEGGTVRGSCFGKRQIFIRFSGCNLAQGAFNSKGCFWCDSPYAQIHTKEFRYEKIPESQKLVNSKNPVKISRIIEIIKELITPDLHSISFTGGEPLHQLKFILNLAITLRDEQINYPLYLETNGSILPNQEILKSLSNKFKYCCCDIKEKSSKAASREKWKKLAEIELNFISNMITFGVETFAKIVVSSQTQIEDIRWICKKLSKIKYPNGQFAGLAIQPVMFEDNDLKEKFSISTTHLNEIFYSAAEILNPESLTLSIQTHKFLKLL